MFVTNRYLIVIIDRDEYIIYYNSFPSANSRVTSSVIVKNLK